MPRDPLLSQLLTLMAGLAVSCASGCTAGRPEVLPIAEYSRSPIESQADLVSDWNAWGDAHLQNGDLVFMRGDCYLMMGTVNFSRLSTDITDSRFSHLGLVAIEQGRACVYDLRSQGCLRTRFGKLLADPQLHEVAVKRHRTVPAEALSEVAHYCRTVFKAQEPYDQQLRLDNDRLYCSELVEAAYRSVGCPLSEPVAIRDLPNFDRHRRALQWIRPLTGIELDQQVLVPGNDRFGIWANPDLELILDVPDTKVRPGHSTSGILRPRNSNATGLQVKGQ